MCFEECAAGDHVCWCARSCNTVYSNNLADGVQHGALDLPRLVLLVDHHLGDQLRRREVRGDGGGQAVGREAGHEALVRGGVLQVPWTKGGM